MRKTLIFIVVIMFFMAMPSICKSLNAPVVPPATVINIVGSGVFYQVKEDFLYGIIESMSFLESTKPANWEAMLKDLHKLKYVSPAEDEEYINIPEFYKKGGDCDDFTIYTVARLFQLGRLPGILIFEPISPQTTKGHITAITLSLDEETILVIDATAKDRENYVANLRDYLPVVMMSGLFKSCRLMWFHRGSVPTDIFKLEED